MLFMLLLFNANADPRKGIKFKLTLSQKGNFFCPSIQSKEYYSNTSNLENCYVILWITISSLLYVLDDAGMKFNMKIDGRSYCYSVTDCELSDSNHSNTKVQLSQFQ